MTWILAYQSSIGILFLHSIAQDTNQTIEVGPSPPNKSESYNLYVLDASYLISGENMIGNKIFYISITYEIQNHSKDNNSLDFPINVTHQTFFF